MLYCERCTGKAFETGALSLVRVQDPINTKIAVLNSTPIAFEDWTIDDPDAESGDRFMLINQLRVQSYDFGQQSELSFCDARLLKIQVMRGVDLYVPLEGKLLVSVMRWVDICMPSTTFVLGD